MKPDVQNVSALIVINLTQIKKDYLDTLEIVTKTLFLANFSAACVSIGKPVSP